MCLCEGSGTRRTCRKYTPVLRRVNRSTPDNYPQDIHRTSRTEDPRGVRPLPFPTDPAPYIFRKYGGEKKKRGKKRRGNLAAPPPLPHRDASRASRICLAFFPTSVICHSRLWITCFIPSGENTGTPPPVDTSSASALYAFCATS